MAPASRRRPSSGCAAPRPFCLRPSVRWCPTQDWRCPLPVPHRTLLLRRKKVTSSRVEPAPARVPRALLPSCLGLSCPRPRLLATWRARPGPAQGTSPPLAAPCGWLHPASWLRQMGPSRPRRHPDASITQKRAAGRRCGGARPSPRPRVGVRRVAGPPSAGGRSTASWAGSRERPDLGELLSVTEQGGPVGLGSWGQLAHTTPA